MLTTAHYTVLTMAAVAVASLLVAGCLGRRKVSATRFTKFGYVISNGNGTMFRCWDTYGPAWTADVDGAMRFARREDAEQLCLTDEDAWRVLPVEVARKTASAVPPYSEDDL